MNEMPCHQYAQELEAKALIAFQLLHSRIASFGRQVRLSFFFLS
jgi:hypothetical protein